VHATVRKSPGRLVDRNGGAGGRDGVGVGNGVEVGLGVGLGVGLDVGLGEDDREGAVIIARVGAGSMTGLEGMEAGPRQSCSVGTTVWPTC